MGLPTILFGLALGTLSALCFALASQGGWAWLAAWPGVSLGALSLGYLVLGSGVAGKRDDGSRAYWATLLHAPVQLAALLLWHVRRRTTDEPVWNQITDDLYVGRRCLTRDELPSDIAMVVDMTVEFAIPSYAEGDFLYRALPTLDGTGMTSKRYREVLAEAAAVEGPVYVHCAIGHGRAAMFAASLLLAKGAAPDLESAIAMLKDKRPRIHLRSGHKRTIKLLHAGAAGHAEHVGDHA